jgi:hypothetical protein
MTTGNISPRLLTYLFNMRGQPRPFMNEIYKALVDDDVTDKGYLFFWKDKNVQSKVKKLKTRLDLKGYDLYALKDLISDRLVFANEEDREELMDALDIEVKRISDPKGSPLLRVIPKKRRITMASL